MPDQKKPEPMQKDKTCGNCKFYQLVLPHEFDFPWSKGFACKNLKVNPDRKDPKGDKLTYDHKCCRRWEW